MIKLLTLKICFLIIFVSALTTSADAQKLRFVEKPVRFPPGANSVVLNGTVTDRVRPLYTFRARKGQTIRVRLTSEDDRAFFNVFDWAEKQENGVDGWDIPNDWTYTFDATDKYKLVVMLNEGAAKYTLEVSLK